MAIQMSGCLKKFATHHCSNQLSRNCVYSAGRRLIPLLLFSGETSRSKPICSLCHSPRCGGKPQAMTKTDATCVIYLTEIGVRTAQTMPPPGKNVTPSIKLPYNANRKTETKNSQQPKASVGRVPLAHRSEHSSHL